MKQLSKNNMILISLTLFSMFFGAGNLIFPSFLGTQAGTNTWIAMVGFSLSAIGFPILGVISVARAGGLNLLAGRVHKVFASVFTLLIYLSIGPCLAIPRTAGTSFEMAVVPFLSKDISVGFAQFIYSILFFGVALYLALSPDKLTDRLGKVLTPCLLVLIFIIFFGCFLNPIGNYSTAIKEYSDNPLVNGFLYGYLTMDTIAALNFGIIISINIQAKGIKEEGSIVKETIKAGWIAGIILLLVYSALAHIGALSGGSFEGSTNGTQTLTNIVLYLFGNKGIIILAFIFTIACLNTCVGLISCCSKYFNTILPHFSYKKWAAFFAFISVIVSNAGLDTILEVSVPILNAIYPIAIVLILLSFIHHFILDFKYVYPITILTTGIFSLLYVFYQNKLLIAFVTSIIIKIPFFELGLGWIIPTIFGLVISVFISIYYNSRNKGMK